MVTETEKQLRELFGSFIMGNGVSRQEIMDYIRDNYTPNTLIQQEKEKYLEEFVEFAIGGRKRYSQHDNSEFI